MSHVVPTAEMAADLLTKAFSTVRLQILMRIYSLIRTTAKEKINNYDETHTVP